MPAPKRTTDHKILSDPTARYMLLVEDAMVELIPRFEALDPPVTYHTYFGDFAGGPGMTIWYAFADRASADRARADGVADRIRRDTAQALLARGYPQEAVDSQLFLDFTSEDEIEAGGGKFYFFR